MIRTLTCFAALCIAAFAAEPKSVTWTGWFADASCHEARATSGNVTAPNPDCSRTCIQKGAAAVFVSQDAKAIFTVKDYPGVLDDLGYRVEVQARVDEAAKTIEILKVNHLESYSASCARPKKQ
jgi:hypothetical protein